MGYFEHTKRTWNATKELFNELVFSGDWVFRGQSNYKWNLRTTLEQMLVDEQLDSSVEYDIVKTFQAKAHNYLEQQELPIDYFDWFSLMQHHGAPTRLLDWTYSPYIASFFALEKAIDSYDYASIYAIETNVLYDKIKNRLELPADRTKVEISARSVLVGSVVINRLLKNDLEIVVPVMPRRFNQRLNTQQGLFLAPGTTKVSFEKNIEAVFPEVDQDSYIRILVQVKAKDEVLNDLHYMNITPETLFPGIDGLARSTRNLRNWV